MRVTNALLAASVVLATLGLAGPAHAQGPAEFRRTPMFTQGVVPDPPEQKRPWTAPVTKLPRFLPRAAALLFEQGVADPRGCEYREVEVGDGDLLTTHGFVLPERPGDAGRFAVGWDGVVYPAFRVGAAADLDTDIRALAGAMKARREEAAAKRDVRFGDPGGFTAGASRLFIPLGTKPSGPSSVETPSALKVCLLLRLGRADLAEALFAAGTGWTPDARPFDLTGYRVSYETLAREWANRVYNRAVDAHGRFDDAIALDAVRRVAAFTKAAGPVLEEMGFAKPQQAGMAGVTPPYFPKLYQLDALLADQERRAKEPPRGPVPGPNAPARERVAALIRDLDQVVPGGGMVMNGMFSPSGSEAERALVREEDAAVEPLLNALVSDDRLTRTVSFPGSRHGSDDRSISPVSQPEYYALLGIMRTRVIPGASNGSVGRSREERKRTAEAIRAFWEKNRGVPMLERYYRTLADDGATPCAVARRGRGPRPAGGRPRPGRVVCHPLPRRRQGAPVARRAPAGTQRPGRHRVDRPAGRGDRPEYLPAGASPGLRRGLQGPRGRPHGGLPRGMGSERGLADAQGPGGPLRRDLPGDTGRALAPGQREGGNRHRPDDPLETQGERPRRARRLRRVGAHRYPLLERVLPGRDVRAAVAQPGSPGRRRGGQGTL